MVLDVIKFDNLQYIEGDLIFQNNVKMNIKNRR